jgi:polyhydroxybutyrate depolymerase
MNKKIIGILVMMLLIITTILPVMGEINYTKVKPKTVNSDHELYYMFHKFLIRRYYVHLPPDYDGSESVPLVILLHGGDQSPLNFSERCDTNDKADKEGFIAVYPMGIGLSDELRGWNMGFGFRLPYYLNIDDFGFIEKLIVTLQNKYNIDNDKIFIAGYSAGAMMAYYLACNLPQGIVAAYAIVGGTIGGHLVDRDLWVNTKPGHPVSIIIFHGLKDSGLPYYGGWNPENTVFFLSVSDSVDFWVENNGCNPEPETEVSDSEEIIIDTYTSGDSRSDVVLYTVKYGLHCWFGEDWMVRDPIKEISTNDEMWNFFESHTL